METDSEWRKSTGAIWPSIAPVKPAPTPTSASKVSARVCFLRSSDPTDVEIHFDKLIPKNTATIAIRIPPNRLP